MICSQQQQRQQQQHRQQQRSICRTTTTTTTTKGLTRRRELCIIEADESEPCSEGSASGLKCGFDRPSRSNCTSGPYCLPPHPWLVGRALPHDALCA